jgi:hypothetical protein
MLTRQQCCRSCQQVEVESNDSPPPFDCRCQSCRPAPARPRRTPAGSKLREAMRRPTLLSRGIQGFASKAARNRATKGWQRFADRFRRSADSAMWRNELSTFRRISGHASSARSVSRLPFAAQRSWRTYFSVPAPSGNVDRREVARAAPMRRAGDPGGAGVVLH